MVGCPIDKRQRLGLMLFRVSRLKATTTVRYIPMITEIIICGYVFYYFRVRFASNWAIGAVDLIDDA